MNHPEASKALEALRAWAHSPGRPGLWTLASVVEAADLVGLEYAQTHASAQEWATTRAVLDLRAGRAPSETDLLGEVEGVDLRFADLRNVDLYKGALRGASLEGADLRDADLRFAALEGADLRGADLRWADLYEADLRDADLTGADVTGATLRWADFRGAELQGVDLRWADAYKVRFIGPIEAD